MTPYEILLKKRKELLSSTTREDRVKLMESFLNKLANSGKEV